MQLEDTRELVGKTATDHRAVTGLYATAASSAVFELLNAYPDVELATVQFRVDVDAPPDITISATGRRGPLVDGEPGCPSCHVHGDQPHTDYCKFDPPTFECGCPTSNIQSHACADPDLHRPDPWHAPLTGIEVRRRCICSGLSINPDCRRHNYDPTEDEPDPVDQADAAAQDQLDAIAEPQWVDDGCRCPTREHHLDGCPTTIQVCQGCGCTDDNGCAPITCYWIEPNLCSNCQL